MRYFIVFYMFNYRSVPIFGSTTAKGDTYPNKKEVESTLGKGHKTEFIHVINIIELTEEDFKNWNQ
jgi:hypothetical protein